MKKQLSVFFLFIVVGVTAQIKVPQASPRGIVKQEVGLTQIEIEYSRPSARGREVFGELVSFGRLWRTGANANTIVSFSEDVVIDGKKLPKGHYGLYTIPNHNKWEVIFYNETNNWGVPAAWDETKILLKTEVNPELVDRFTETFTINVNAITNDAAIIELLWEKTSVSFKVEVPTDNAVMSNISNIMNGPSDADYFAAAQYYYQANKDANKALAWVNKAIEMKGQDAFWYLRLKALLHYRVGDKKNALEAAKKSLESAQKANNFDYVKLNTDSINDWSKK
jgi:hypothetical protein